MPVGEFSYYKYEHWISTHTTCHFWPTSMNEKGCYVWSCLRTWILFQLHITSIILLSFYYIYIYRFGHEHFNIDDQSDSVISLILSSSGKKYNNHLIDLKSKYYLRIILIKSNVKIGLRIWIKEIGDFPFKSGRTTTNISIYSRLEQTNNSVITDLQLFWVFCRTRNSCWL